MLRNQFLPLILLIFLFLIFGCHRGGSPVTPEKPGGENAGLNLSGENTRELMNRGHHLLALMECRFDAKNESLDVTELRSAFQHMNLVQILPQFCKPVSTCLKFQDLEVDEPNLTIELNVVVTHPIPDPNIDVFDLRGIGIFKSNMDPDFYGGPIATQILNADGFTTAYDVGGDFDAFLNPYVAFNEEEPERRFEHLSTASEHIICKFPSFAPEDSSFLYALDASWYDPALVNPGDPSTDPNIPEPYKVNILYPGLISNEYFAEGTAVVELWDWQQNPSTVDFECPALFTGPTDMTKAYSNGDRFVYYVNYINDEEPDSGSYPILVRAQDFLVSQQDLINPTITVELANYQLGLDPEKSVTVYDPVINTAPHASVVASDLVIEAGQTIHFDASGSWDAEDIAVGSYAWDFDGSFEFAGGSDPVMDKQFNEIGVFGVNIMVEDTLGFTDILDMPILITVNVSTNTPPVADAYASNYSPALFQTITLNAEGSTDEEDGKPIKWEWDLDNDLIFDDATGEIINYAWDTPATYYVDVKVTDSGGLTDTLNAKLEITVQDAPNQYPIAIAEADKSDVVVGEIVTFDGSASYDPDGTINKYEWDLNGDGIYTDKFGPIVTNKYWTAGVYNTDLKVTDLGGLTDTLNEKITITVTGVNHPPVAIAETDKTLVHTDESFHLSAKASYDPEETLVSVYAWDLYGNGTYIDNFQPEFDWGYEIPGVYEIDVRVCDTPGLCDTLDTKLIVQVYSGDNHPPVAQATASDTLIYEGDTVHFNGSKSFDPEDGSPTSFQWDLDGDGAYDDSPFITPDWTYYTEGIYDVDLMVKDKEGLFDTLDQKIKITVVPVGTNFPPDAVGQVNCTFPITGQPVHCTSLSSDLDGYITKWEWDFGDGNGWQDFTLTEGDVWHAFDTENVYMVNHRVTDDLGAVKEIPNTISVFVQLDKYAPPTNPPDCSDAMESHSFVGFDMFKYANTTLSSRDLAFVVEDMYLAVIADSLYRVVQPVDIVEPPLLYGANWVKSIDATTQTGIVALSGLDNGQVKIYSLQGTMFQLIKQYSLGEPIHAVCFDNNDGLWLLTDESLIRLESPGYNLDACGSYKISNGTITGAVQDMEFSSWNRCLYVAINDGMNGKVTVINYKGIIQDSLDNVLNGPSNYMDIIVDNVVSDVGTIGCRIEVFGGINEGYVTRLDADLNVIKKRTYGYWGIRAAALNPGMLNNVIVLEECCLSWVDILMAPFDWMEKGG
ncbi:MAG: PKD domain-containing protein [bacterium]